jgi:F0F1-type ATP synthase assembly protein I
VQQRKTEPGAAADVSRYLGLGLTMAASTALFLYLGSLADRRLGTEPWLTLVGAFVGAAAGFYYMYRHLVIEPQRSGRGDGRGVER